MKIIIGLGNPGEEYAGTRHNIGRMMVEAFAKKNKFDDFEFDKKLKALVSKGEVGKEKVMLVEPEPFMNKSGVSVAPLVKSKKAAEALIVVHDDLDMPLGKFKISFNRSSGGHRGVESVIRAIKTEAFIRVKIGVSPSTASGKLKKPTGEKVLDFIIGKFRKPELDDVKSVSKKVSTALEMLVLEGREKAMGEFNGK